MTRMAFFSSAIMITIWIWSLIAVYRRGYDRARIDARLAYASRIDRAV